MAFGEHAALVDDANRADGNISFGGPWANKAQNESGATALTTISEQIASPGDKNVITSASFGPDIEYYVTLATVPSQYAFLTGRLNGANSSAWQGYGVLWGPAVAESAQIRKYVAGSNTTLATSGFFPFTAGDKLGLSIIGNKITAYRWHAEVWSEMVSATDSAYTAAGPLGLWIGDSTGRLDNVFAGTVGGATSLSVPAPAKSFFFAASPTTARKAATPAAPARWAPSAPASLTGGGAGFAVPAAPVVKFTAMPSSRGVYLPQYLPFYLAEGSTPTMSRKMLAAAAMLKFRALDATMPGGIPVPTPLLPSTATIGEFLAAANILNASTLSSAAVEQPPSAAAAFGDATASAIVRG